MNGGVREPPTPVLPVLTVLRVGLRPSDDTRSQVDLPWVRGPWRRTGTSPSLPPNPRPLGLVNTTFDEGGSPNQYTLGTEWPLSHPFRRTSCPRHKHKTKHGCMDTQSEDKIKGHQNKAPWKDRSHFWKDRSYFFTCSHRQNQSSPTRLSYGTGTSPSLKSYLTPERSLSVTEECQDLRPSGSSHPVRPTQEPLRGGPHVFRWKRNTGESYARREKERSTPWLE